MSAPRGETRARPTAQRVDEGGIARRLRAWREQHAWSLVSSLGRFFQRPFATLLTVGVMAVAMALPLALGLVLANLERLSGSVQASREIGVFLRTGVDAAAAQRLATTVRERRDVAGVVVKTPDEGLAEFRQLSELAGALALVDDNPLPFVLRVQPANGGDAALAKMLAARPEVELVQHDAVWRRRLDAWLAFGRQLAWVMAGLFALGVLLVVGNTVRLEIGARHDEIAVLQQLGATDGFVRRPFIYLGAWYGLAAGLLALALLALAAALLQPGLASLVGSYGSSFRVHGPDVLSVVVIVFTTTALGWLGAWLASGHQLRQTRPTDL
jgi:cell division transport system permease protein